MTKRKTEPGVSSRERFNPNVLPVTFDSYACLKHLAKALRLGGNSLKEQVALDMYLSKYMDDEKVSPEFKRQAAIDKWRRVEHLNARTNARLYLDQFDTDFGWVTSDRILSYMRSLISRTLGKAPKVGKLPFSITNGASTRVYRGYQACYQKVSGNMHCSTSALPLWLEFVGGSLLGDRLMKTGIEVMDCSMLLTVPKKTEIDRVIACEPECNAILQRGIGIRIRDRLLRAGIDLRDQTRNQKLAFEGSCSGKLATIDFSSASDTLTTQLVTLLMPTDWWMLMDATRVSATIVDGTRHDFELWSSMGNGYTFELETLIFWALAHAVCYYSGKKGAISVYGDDVILPTSVARRYMRIARWFGFLPNEAKSFVDGYYRESCGKHYSRGQDVTPFFVRGEIKTYSDLIGILNQVLEWNCRGYGFFVDEPIHRWWKAWSEDVPPFLRGGVDPMDPGVLVDGSNTRKSRLTSLSEVTRLCMGSTDVVDEWVQIHLYDHPAGLALALATGGRYSTATRDMARLKLARHRPFGTVSYTPSLIMG